jgi:hypothetical protein
MDAHAVRATCGRESPPMWRRICPGSSELALTAHSRWVAGVPCHVHVQKYSPWEFLLHCRQQRVLHMTWYSRYSASLPVTLAEEFDMCSRVYILWVPDNSTSGFVRNVEGRGRHVHGTSGELSQFENKRITQHRAAVVRPWNSTLTIKK